MEVASRDEEVATMSIKSFISISYNSYILGRVLANAGIKLTARHKMAKIDKKKKNLSTFLLPLS